MATERPRVSVTLDDELLKKIDDYRFENRIMSRSLALNELIKIGLDLMEKDLDDKKNE